LSYLLALKSFLGFRERKGGRQRWREEGKKKHMERQKEFECMLFNIELLVQVLKL
jgi:hypothetical protein